MKSILNLVKEIKSLPLVSIQLSADGKEGKKLYKVFNKRHPRFPLVKHKSLGVGLLLLDSYSNSEDYMKKVNGKNSAAYFSRKALRSEFEFKQINPNNYVDDIHAIHMSANVRQGIALSDSYFEKITSYVVDNENTYYGVLKDNTLVAYAWCLNSGELCLFNRIMGHQEHLNAGVMYLLVTSIVRDLCDTKKAKFLMYDTMLGASDGLKMFKKRCGFKPFRVKWKLK